MKLFSIPIAFLLFINEVFANLPIEFMFIIYVVFAFPIAFLLFIYEVVGRHKYNFRVNALRKGCCNGSNL